MPEKILFMPLCIIFEITAYFILFKPQNKSVLLLSVLLCFLSTVNMALDVLFNINGDAEILRELNKVLYISSSNFIIVLAICMAGIFIIKGKDKKMKKQLIPFKIAIAIYKNWIILTNTNKDKFKRINWYRN